MITTKWQRRISRLLTASFVVGILPFQALALSREDVGNLGRVWIWDTAHSEQEYPNGQSAIYIGTTGAIADEAGGLYGLTLYRDGDVSQPATVSLSSVDVSATYGVDYVFVNQPDTIFHQTNGTLFQQGFRTDADIQEQMAVYQDVVEQAMAEQAEDTAPATDSSASAVYQGKTTAQALAEASQVTGKSTLALLKEAQTGEATRAVASDVAALPAQTEPMPAVDISNYLEVSTTVPITFAAGQTEQYVVLQILDDTQAEDTELAAFLLDHVEGAQLGTVSNCIVQITDDEEREPAYVAFAQDSFAFTASTGDLVLTRTGADYTMVAAEVMLFDQDGQSVDSQTVTFSPYQTTATLALDLEGQGAYTAVLSDCMACEPADITEASLQFAVQDAPEDAPVVEDAPEVQDVPTDLPVGEDAPIIEEDTPEAEDVPVKEDVPKVQSSAVVQSSHASGASDSSRITLSGKTGTGGHPLEVEYVANQRDAYGNLFGYIYDTGLVPEVAVGKYYFVEELPRGIFGEDSPNHSHYDLRGSAPNSYIYLDWYSAWMYDTGGVYVHLNELSSFAVDSFFADFQMTRDGGSYNRVYFRAYQTNGAEVHTRATDAAPRGLLEISIDNTWATYDRLHFDLKDAYSSACPITEANFHGFGAMYSKFDVTAGESGKMSFLNGTDGNTSTTEKLPVTTNLGEGHSTRYFEQSLQIQSNASDESGVMYGNLLGYQVEVLNYASDKNNNVAPSFYYLANGVTDEDIQSQKLDSSPRYYFPAGANLSNIKFDQDFLEKVYDRIDGYERKAETKLQFTPLYGYKDVTVDFREETVDGQKIGFDAVDNLTDLHAGDCIYLKATAPEGYHYAGYSYQARLSDDTTASVKEGNVFVTDDTAATLTLGAHNLAYYALTPIFVKDTVNYIALSCDETVTVLNTLTAAQIALVEKVFSDYNFPKNTAVLVVDAAAEPDATATVPAGSTASQAEIDQARAILGQIATTPGKVYTIYATTNDPDATPVFHDAGGGQIGFPDAGVTSFVLDFVASSHLEQNKLTLTTDSAPRDQFFQLHGTLYLPKHSVRMTDAAATLPDLPAEGATVYASGAETMLWLTSKADGSATKSLFVDRRNGQVNNIGAYDIIGVQGAVGDWVSLYAINGTVEKVFYVQLTDTANSDYDVSSIEGMSFNKQVATDAYVNTAQPCQEDGFLLTAKRDAYLPVYTTGMPEIQTVEYTYDTPSNTAAFGTLANGVAIAKDYFTITAKINPMGREIKQVDFIIDTRIGSDTTYTVSATTTNQTIFECNLGGKRMDKVLGDGDRLFLTLHDAQGDMVSFPVSDADGNPVLDVMGNPVYSTSEVERVYATVFSGLSFYVPNMELAPQEFALENPTSLDVPLFGTASGSTTSGVASFTKTAWDTDPCSPFTLTCAQNQALDLWNKAIPTPMQRWQTLEGSTNNATAKAEAVEPSSKPSTDDKATPDAPKKDLQQAEDDTKKCAAPKSKYDQFSKFRFGLNFVVLMDFHMAYNASTDEFELIGGQVMFGGIMSIARTFYTTVYGVPLYLTFSGTFEVDLIGNYLTDAGSTISESNFYLASNIQEVLPKADVGFLVKATIKGSLGVGLSGTLSARGTVIGNFQCYFGGWMPEGDTTASDNFKGGAMVTLSGGFGVDLLLFTFEFVPPLGTLGCGIYEDRSEFLPFIPKAATLQAYDPQAAMQDLYLIGVREQVTGESADNFAGTPTHTGNNPASYHVLLDDAPEHARPELLELPDGRKFMTFLAKKDNVLQLHYSLFDGTSSWSDPEPVDADGTVDATASLALYGNKVCITWVDSDQKGAVSIDNLAETLSHFDLSLCTYDLDTDTLGAAISLTDRQEDWQYMDYNPILATDSDGERGAGILFLKRDTLSHYNDPEDLVDATQLYQTIALATWNGTTVNEHFLPIVGDPLVTHLDAVLLPDLVDGDNFLLCAYTTDADKDFTSTDDQEVSLLFYNLTDHVTYAPIPVTNNYIADTQPQLTKLANDEVLLTWLSTQAGAEDDVQTDLHTLNIGDMLKEIDTYYGLSKFFKVSGDADTWYQQDDWYEVPKSAITANTEYDYAYSIFKRLNQKNLATSGTALQMDGCSVYPKTYELAESDGSLYLFFSADASQDSTVISSALYGMVYRMSTPEVSADGDGYKQIDSNTSRLGWGQPVKLTDFENQIDSRTEGIVLDDCQVSVDSDGDFTFVSNLFTQKIDDITEEGNGRISYSDHKLVTFGINTAADCEISDISITPQLPMPGQICTVQYTVRNVGLEPLQGYTGTVTVNGTTFPVSDSATLLFGGEGLQVQTVDTFTQAIGADSKVAVKVTSDETSNKPTAQDTMEINYLPDLQLTYSALTMDDNGNLLLPITLTNHGNAPADAFALTLRETDVAAEGRTPATQTVAIPAISAGESYAVTVRMDSTVLSPEHFSDYGIASLMAENTADTPALATAFSLYHARFAERIAYVPEPEEEEDDRRRPTTTTTIPVVPEEPTVPAIPFVDVPATAWYAEAVAYVVANGLFNGMSADTFVPTANMTRGMLFTVLHRYSGDDQHTATTPWYQAGMDWAMAVGVSDGTYPNGNITREQLVTMLYRYIGSPAVSGDLSAYHDGHTVSDWAVDAMIWATQLGILNGQTPTTLVPKAPATRAEVATIIMRFAEMFG